MQRLKRLGSLLGVTALLALSFTVLASCGSGRLGNRVVVDEARWLKDGEAISWKLEPGLYKVETTASSNGVSVKWIGASCPGCPEGASCATLCELTQTGQVIIENPTLLGLGSPTSVTVRITRLAR